MIICTIEPKYTFLQIPLALFDFEKLKSICYNKGIHGITEVNNMIRLEFHS